MVSKTRNSWTAVAALLAFVLLIAGSREPCGAGYTTGRNPGACNPGAADSRRGDCGRHPGPNFGG